MSAKKSLPVSAFLIERAHLYAAFLDLLVLASISDHRRDAPQLEQFARLDRGHARRAAGPVEIGEVAGGWIRLQRSRPKPGL